MANISKEPLDIQTQERLFKQLSDLFATADKNSSQKFFAELLTETERIMLMKRLAVIFMLDKNFSVYRIAKTLHMSKTTVAHMQQKYLDGLYDAIVTVIRKKEFNTTQFLSTLETLLQAGMPSMGKKRWKSLRM